MGHVSEHVALELQTLAGTEARHGKTRATGEHGQYNVVYEYARGGRRRRGRPDRRRPRQPPRLARRPVDGRLRLPDGARAAHPARRAAGLRPVDAGAHRRGRAARHPLDPARSLQPRPARPGRPPAAHPGDDDLAHRRHRGRHRLGQEPDQRPPQCGRAARAALRGRRRCRRRGASGRVDRLPVRRQAARRQPRPWRQPRPARRGRRAPGVPAGAARNRVPATSSSRPS